MTDALSRPAVRPVVHVVSLSGSPRRARMAEQLDPLGLDWSFFDACTAPPQGLRYDPATARRRHGRELTPGELGCFASHVALWGEAAADPAGRMHVILEDDLLIDPVFFGDLAAVATAFAPYDYLRLYAKVPAGIRREGPFLNRHIARFSGRAYGTQGYLLSANGAKRFLVSVRCVERPIDDEMDRFWAHGLPTRCVFPAPVIEVQYGSTIEDKRRRLDQLGTAERLRWTTSKLIEKFRRHAAAFRP